MTGSTSRSMAAFALLLAGHLATAVAQEASGPWLVRGGIAHIEPRSHPGSIFGGAADVTVRNGAGPTLGLSYFVTPTVAIDVLGALPFKHDIQVNGAKAGSIQHLPPVVSLQYHFAPAETLRPYAGVGVNFTTFSKEKLDNGAALKLSNSWGVALQLGADYAIDQRWSAGADVRYAKIATDLSINGAEVGRIRIDPVVFGVNVGYRF